MGLMETIAENRIRAAQDEGLFRNLPGQGQPLNLEDDSSIPEDLRLSLKILKNAGCLPIEMELHGQIGGCGPKQFRMISISVWHQNGQNAGDRLPAIVQHRSVNLRNVRAQQDFD